MFMVRPMGPGQQGMPMPMQASLGAKGLFFHVIRGGTLVGSWWTTGSSAGRRPLGLACHPACSMLLDEPVAVWCGLFPSASASVLPC